MTGAQSSWDQRSRRTFDRPDYGPLPPGGAPQCIVCGRFVNVTTARQVPEWGEFGAVLSMEYECAHHRTKQSERPPLRKGYGYAATPPCTCVVKGPDYFGQYDLFEDPDCPLHGLEENA